MTKKRPKHRASDPPNNIAQIIAEKWHVGRSFPGMAPAIETTCPCPKAPCGLVIPDTDVDCDQHKGDKALRTMHAADRCKKVKIKFGKKMP